jgi:hypothetical protein
MKEDKLNVLIISSIYLPMDVVGSYRPKSFMEVFPQTGISPTLLTTNWELEHNGFWKKHEIKESIKVEKNNHREVYRVPYFGVKSPTRNPILRALNIIRILKGNLDPEQYFNYLSFRKSALELVKRKKFDLIIGIYTPHFCLKLVYELNKKYNIPYVLDFQDLWINELVVPNYSADFKQTILNRINLHYWKKWINSSLFFTTTSQLWIEYLEKHTKKRGHIIRNGHDFKLKPRPKYPKDIFRITYFGRLYPNMEYSIVFEALTNFLKYQKQIPIQFELIGIKPTSDFDGVQFVKNELPYPNIVFKEGMKKTELLEYCRLNSTVLILPNFPYDNGQFMVKLYDYLYIGKPIIFGPSNGSDMENTISTCNSGIISNSSTQLEKYLISIYDELSSTGNISFKSNYSIVNEYNREVQSEKLSSLIRSEIVT